MEEIQTKQEEASKKRFLWTSIWKIKKKADSVSALTIIGDKMENLETYIAFDLEFNTVDGVSHIIRYRPLR